MAIRVTSNERLYLSEDGKKIVREGDPRAGRLACEAGKSYLSYVYQHFPNGIPGVSLPEYGQ